MVALLTRANKLIVATITMDEMAALDVRSGSVGFDCRGRSRCKRQVSANVSERATTLATFFDAEGRGFEPLHPL